MQHEFPFSIFLLAFVAYSAILFLVSALTSNKNVKGSFFSGDRKAPWPIVAYGMIGASMTGVSFISVPGNVTAQNFYYLPLVFGFIIGYVVIAKVLLPLYYKKNLTSIYSYLGERFGWKSYRTGTVVFLISRLLGAAVRIFVVILVLDSFIPKTPFTQSHHFLIFLAITVIFLTLLYLYTFRGGVKTIIWTDVFQTTLMLIAIASTIIFICREMGWNFSEMFSNTIVASNPSIDGTHYSDMFDWRWASGTNAIKQFISGIFITIAMTGLDQSMMQKSLTCKNLQAAQKNMYTTAANILIVNFFFVFLGALLSVYISSKGGMAALGIEKTDQIFPTIASSCLGLGAGLIFLVGLISASYPSAGNALTSMTTAFCMDFLSFDANTSAPKSVKQRKIVHFGFVLAFLTIILILFLISNDAVVNLVYKLASYTYGPILGLFFFGILTKWQINDKATPYIAILAPLICILINIVGRAFFNFELGFTLLIVNGLLTFFGLWLFRQPETSAQSSTI